MSERAPGSPAWWLETGLIAAAGALVAAWLWPWPGEGGPQTVAAAPDQATPAPARPATLADMVAAGCLTQEHLRRLREGQDIRVICPEATPPQDAGTRP